MKLYFTLENEKMPIDYRRSIISFIKLSLSEYSENEFKKYYNQKDNIIKPYAFSIFFKHPKFNTKEISCPNIREDSSYELTDNRHIITFVTKLDRDKIYENLFKKLGE